MKDLFDTTPAASPAEIDKTCRQVMLAMALLWGPHPRTSIFNVLHRLGLKHENGRHITADEVKHCTRQLVAHKLAFESRQHNGHYQLAPEQCSALCEELLDTTDPLLLRQTLYDLHEIDSRFNIYSWPVYDREATAGIVRIALLTHAPKVEIERMASRIGRVHDWNGILLSLLKGGSSGKFLMRVEPDMRWELGFLAITTVSSNWDATLLPAASWVLAQAKEHRAQMPAHLRLAIAELLLHRGDRTAARSMLEGVDRGPAQALEAYALAQEAKWPEAQALFESAIKKRQAEIGAKKRIFPASIAWIYPLILLAQQTPKHLELARKFCVGEAGKREPEPYYGWGLWVHAVDVRRGDAELAQGPFLKAEHYPHHAGFDHLWRLLLTAWLGVDVMRSNSKTTRDALTAMAETQVAQLRRCGLDWLAYMAEGASAIINDKDAPSGYFVAGKTEQWRELLSALQALGEDAPAQAGSGESTRLIWNIVIGKGGALENILPMEQKRGARGWSKPKPLALGKIAGNPHLSPHDAKVANCIHASKYGRRDFTLDLPGAAQALVGHPAVVLDDNPDQFVELSEGTPEIEVGHKGDKITLKVTPPLRDVASVDRHFYYDADEKREAEALRLITLVRDTPQRVRLIRFTAAQRRAAQLLAERISIPSSAQKELHAAMQALTSHFQLQSDSLQVAREVPAETLLRAELSPLGDGVLLRLVATPLGAEGPRLAPGSGRSRLMAPVGGESIGTTRQLDTERAHRDAVLDALPFLEDCPGDSSQCEWEVTDPENALALVEALPSLPAISALDWPKGRAVRVTALDLPQLAVKVSSERDWFRVEGQAQADEGMVFTFEALLAAAQSSSRFIAMGNGVYAALTRTLKERLSDLASVSEADKHGARVPRLAAAWLNDALDGAELKTDKEFRSALEQLRAAQQQSIPLPDSLQAELRPYQEDGYVWASRLAQAGFGGCLADDMGLGKTLQSLALLLARADGGPALIIAPTSVCGNWVAEALRFAPSLNLRQFGEGDRDAVLSEAAAYDVVVASYTLLQQSSEKFAKKKWHTVIADEAQAIKNATAKRTQAVFELDADFRLALSGTPVENRLAELWSIMRFANPGLLGALNRFNERFATPIERNKSREAQHTLRRLIAPFLLRRTKSQVLQELPPRTELVITVATEKTEASHYEALRRQAVAEADQALASTKAGQARMNILAQLTRLRRAACDPRIVTPAFGAPGAKVQAFAELAAELTANGHKALVFSQFVDFLALLREPLDAAGIPYQYLDGATPSAERTRRVAAFQKGQGDLFLISLKAGGFGLNLTVADYVVITDPWWNPAAEDQAMGRAHRIGQQRPVTVYRLVTKGTVEEHIVGLHNDKRALAESILGEGEAAQLPSTEELMALIRGD